MTRSTRASGETLEAALRAAVADLLECSRDEVALRLSAPGVEDLSGRVRLDLQLEAAAASGRGVDDRNDAPEGDGEAKPAGRTDTARVASEGDDRDGEEELAAPPLTAEDLDAEADAAADLLEGLLDALDLPGDLRMRFHDDHVEIEVVDVGSGVLIGRRGQTLEAIQEIVRCALQRQFQRRTRVKVDIEGYRARRLEKLLEKAEEAIDAVLDTGRAERLEPMDVFERKAVHQLVAQVEGLTSRSQGREPARRVVIERE